MAKSTLLGCTVVFTVAVPVLASTLRVPQDFPTIQEAVDAAAIDDIVAVAAGTYPGPVLIDGKNHLTLKAADPMTGPVVIDAKEQPYGIVARNLDGLVLEWLTVDAYPSEVNRSGILLDGAGVAGGGPAPLSRVVIRFTNIKSPGNGIDINGGTVHVVSHCNDIQVGGDYAVGWGSNDLIRVKYSHLSSLPGTSPRYAIYAAGTCEPYTDGTVSFHNRIYRNRIEGSFAEAMRFQNVQDHIVGNNVVRLAAPTRDGRDTFGIVFGPGCVQGSLSFDVSVLSNDVAGARYALVLGALDGARVMNNKFGGNGSRSQTPNSPLGYGGAVFIGVPDDFSSSVCGLNIRLNNMLNLLSPRTEPAVWIDQAGCNAANNVMDRTNTTDPGRKLVGP
ncbi:MAG: hypothetical protein HYR85_15040 [Planctomycetes bacterium]|nr:hypothetical protein [Planctomycetota bacterium]MBI3846020.1 hypothetical protein [Planctomycetota bacterium]